MGYDKDKMQIPDSLQKFTKELPADSQLVNLMMSGVNGLAVS
ncbi:hypothetical protein [Mesobacillus boroniphilus]|nr:hypothetical protein [Mesobacillus boroniphilus]